MTRTSLIPACLSVVLLSACATGPKITPELMDRQGLLIGKVVRITPLAYEGNAIGLAGTPLIYEGNATINGQVYKGAVKGGYIRLPLPPGNYKLERLSHTSSTSTTSMGVRFTTSHSSEHAVQADFSVKAGEVTNLGLVAAIYVDDGKTLKTRFVDNSPDMKAFLKKEYPAVLTALRTTEFNLANADYLDNKQIEALRKLVLRFTLKGSLPGDYVTAPLGTLVKLEKDRQGKLVGLDFIDTGTFESLKSCKYFKKRFACVVPHPDRGDTLLITDNGRLVWRRLPVQGPVNLFFVGDEEVVLVTEKMVVFSSPDNGKRWAPFRDAALSEPIDREYMNKESVGMLLGKRGYYLYSRAGDATLLYRQYGSDRYRRIAPPAQGAVLGDIHETDKGLYSEPDFTIFGDATMYFLPSGGSQWLKRTVPGTDCRSLRVLDSKADKIAAMCSKIYISTDSGESWRQSFASELN